MNNILNFLEMIITTLSQHLLPVGIALLVIGLLFLSTILLSGVIAYIFAPKRSQKPDLAGAWPELVGRTGVTFVPKVKSLRSTITSLWEKRIDYLGEYRGRQLSLAKLSAYQPPKSKYWGVGRWLEFSRFSLRVNNATNRSLLIRRNWILARAFRLGRLSSGNADFDQQFEVRGQPPEFVQRAIGLVVGADPRLLVRLIQNDSFIELQGENLVCRQSGELANVYYQIVLLDLLSDLAELIERKNVMDATSVRIERLRSPFRIIRYKACEQFRVAPNLTQEAVTALQRACYDPDPDVARAAYQTLLAHKSWSGPPPMDGLMDKSLPGPLSKKGVMDKLDRPPERIILSSDEIRQQFALPLEENLFPYSEPSSLERFWLRLTHKIKKILSRFYRQIVFLWIAFFLFLLFGLGSTSELSCKRTQSGAQVNCVEQLNLFFLIPMSTQEIYAVHGAEVVMGFTYDDDPFFDVHLLTEYGSVALNSGPSFGPSSKYDVADKINDFVSSDTEENLSIVDPGAFNAECFLALLLPPIFAILLMIALEIFPAQDVAHLWKKIKSTFIRS